MAAFSTTSLLLLAAVVAAAAAAELASLSAFHRRADRAVLRATVSNPNCSSKEWSGCTDCRTRRHCQLVAPNIWQESTPVSCSGSTPYCSEGDANTDSSCVADSTCTAPAPTPTTDFNCVGNGYYPHPTDCNKYYVCLDGDAYAASCSDYTGTHFDAASGLCKQGIACTTARCPGGGTQTFITWPTASWITASCLTSNDINKAFFSQCEKGSIWDGKKCDQGACIKEGRFKDPLDTADKPTRYIECVDLGSGKFNVPKAVTCPKGNFDETLGQCRVA